MRCKTFRDIWLSRAARAVSVKAIHDIAIVCFPRRAFALRFFSIFESPHGISMNFPRVSLSLRIIWDIEIEINRIKVTHIATSFQNWIFEHLKFLLKYEIFNILFSRSSLNNSAYSLTIHFFVFLIQFLIPLLIFIVYNWSITKRKKLKYFIKFYEYSMGAFRRIDKSQIQSRLSPRLISAIRFLHPVSHIHQFEACFAFLFLFIPKSSQDSVQIIQFVGQCLLVALRILPRFFAGAVWKVRAPSIRFSRGMYYVPFSLILTPSLRHFRSLFSLSLFRRSGSDLLR